MNGHVGKTMSDPVVNVLCDPETKCESENESECEKRMACENIPPNVPEKNMSRERSCVGGSGEPPPVRKFEAGSGEPPPIEKIGVRNGVSPVVEKNVERSGSGVPPVIEKNEVDEVRALEIKETPEEKKIAKEATRKKPPELRVQFDLLEKGKEKCAKVSGVWYESESSVQKSHEYRLAPCWREWALARLGVDPRDVKVDLFAQVGDRASCYAIDRSENAFAFDWSRLCENEGEVLWANPPFQIMSKVLGKIKRDPCRVVLLYPVWEEAKWWETLQSMIVVSVYLPKGECLFNGSVRKDMLPPPKWRAMVCVVDTRDKKVSPPSPRLGKVLNQECEGLGLRELKQMCGPPLSPVKRRDE